MKNKQTTLGVIFGAGIGLSVGILTDNIDIGLSIGAGVGLVLETSANKKIKLRNKE